MGVDSFSSLFLNLFVEEKKSLFTQTFPVGSVVGGTHWSSMAQPCTPTHTLGFYRVLRGV